MSKVDCASYTRHSHWQCHDGRHVELNCVAFAAPAFFHLCFTHEARNDCIISKFHYHHLKYASCLALCYAFLVCAVTFIVSSTGSNCRMVPYSFCRPTSRRTRAFTGAWPGTKMVLPPVEMHPWKSPVSLLKSSFH